MSDTKRIGVYGGTFDPIHLGHLILARVALETFGFEKIVFIPAAGSPHKRDRRLSAPDIRYAMLRAAIQGEPGLDLDDIELRRPPPSYTVDTMEAMRDREPGAEWFYLVGEDNLPRLTTWHRFGDLEKLVRFVILERSGVRTEHPYATVRKYVDISATEIRNRVATGRSIRYLVPPPVEKIIRDEQLYREPER